MSTFTADDVRRLARLARLDLPDDEVALFAGQLRDVLAFAQQIHSVGSAAPPAPASADEVPPLRADVVRPSLSPEDVLSAAPDADAAAGLFKVPRVLHE